MVSCFDPLLWELQNSFCTIRGSYSVLGSSYIAQHWKPRSLIIYHGKCLEQNQQEPMKRQWQEPKEFYPWKRFWSYIKGCLWKTIKQCCEQSNNMSLNLSKVGDGK